MPAHCGDWRRWQGGLGAMLPVRRGGAGGKCGVGRQGVDKGSHCQGGVVAEPSCSALCPHCCSSWLPQVPVP